MVVTATTTCKSQPFSLHYRYDTTIMVDENILQIDVFFDTISKKTSYFYEVKTGLGEYTYDCDYCRLVRKDDQVLFYNTYIENSNSNSYKRLLKDVVSLSNIPLDVLSTHTMIKEERIYDFLFRKKMLTIQEYDRLTSYLSWRANIILDKN